MLIYAVFLTRQLHTPTNLLLLSLAVSDFFVGFLMLFQIVLLDGCWFFGDMICAAYYVLDYTITSASIGTMVLISVDRYVAICDPLHYPTKITQTRLQISISLCWTFSLIFHTVRFKDNLKQPGRYNSCVGQCVVVIDYAAGLTDLLMSFIGPVTVIVVLYIKVFGAAVSHARAMRSHITAVTLQYSLKIGVKKTEMKTAAALGVVVVVFLICVCPYFCVVLTGQETLISASTSAFIICLFYFNSCLNPLIYTFFYSRFRKSVRLIVTLKILQADSRNTHIP